MRLKEESGYFLKYPTSVSSYPLVDGYGLVYENVDFIGSTRLFLFVLQGGHFEVVDLGLFGSAQPTARHHRGSSPWSMEDRPSSQEIHHDPADRVSLNVRRGTYY